MSLKKLSLQSEYRSDGANLVTDFYKPCLRNATQYWRAVGYFTSNSLEHNTEGLATFIQHGGQMRLVTSRKLMPDDIEAIQRGYDTKELNLAVPYDRDFEEVIHDRLRLLTWLVAYGHLDIKIAYLSNTNAFNSQAMYHEKIGIFSDDMGNTIAFAGSQNETASGLLNNFEFIDVYWSWNDPQQRVQQKVDNFKRLWNNTTNKLKVIDFPTAVSEDILIHQGVYETDPDLLAPYPQAIMETMGVYLPNGLELRECQSEAIDAWFKNGCHGLWEMATGTGKTIAALAALAKLKEEKKPLLILIVCPFKHLVNQWYKEAEKFKFDSILAYENTRAWFDEMNNALNLHNWSSDQLTCVITTRQTFISDPMQTILRDTTGNAVLVADEVHHLGSEQSLQGLTDTFNYRLGLSATLDRHFDDKGTRALKSYFGERVYELSLDTAIKKGYLCSYYYHPHLVELTDDELQEYEKLTRKISRLVHWTNFDEPHQARDLLLLERSMLMNKAANKLPMLEQLLVDKIDSLHHTLFYCAPGQIDSVISMLASLGLKIAKFTARESAAKREKLLKSFASGSLQALVAMRCLDEGVDVPSTQTAYILASSSNPKEFIQRRGRILRQFPGKDFAEIHDLFAVPPLEYQEYSNVTFAVERKIVERELKRFNEFAGTAQNQFRAYEKVWELAEAYNLLGVLGGS